MVGKTKGKILITGAEGRLGSALFQELNKRYPTVGTQQKDLDITDSQKVNEAILKVKPWMVVHTAALTDVDSCEETPKLAYEVNALGTRNVVQASKAAGTILAYISTDHIFDGTENKPYTENQIPHPINIYGQTKLEGERFVAENLDNFLIIRTSWLFGKGKAGFVEKIIEQAKIKKTISVVADKYASPTFSLDLAQAILEIIYLIEKKQFVPGKSVLHITNSGFCSWFEYAKKILELAKIEAVALEPIKSEDFKSKAKRPQFSVLDNSYYNKLSGKPLRLWTEALKEHLQCLKN